MRDAPGSCNVTLASRLGGARLVNRLAELSRHPDAPREGRGGEPHPAVLDVGEVLSYGLVALVPEHQRQHAGGVPFVLVARGRRVVAYPDGVPALEEQTTHQGTQVLHGTDPCG